MKYSEAGLNLTKSFESCKLYAYPDSSNIPTIGWGHTREVYMGLFCSPMQADAWLEEDVQYAVNKVLSLVLVPLTQNQFDALVDFVYNVGSGHFKTSTLLRKLNAGDYVGASLEFIKWDHANGQVVPGLTRRRLAEQALFNS